MRTLVKLAEPTVLALKGKEWLKAHLADPQNSTKKYRYRHPEIKTRLTNETGYKCIYCESKIGHNTPGDIEHIIPSSKNRKLHFTWENITIACTECNRRKNDFYVKGKEFLNPYKDQNIEEQVIHLGPLVYPVNKNKRAEKTVRTLELNNENRIQLIIRKMEIIASLQNELERYYTEKDNDLKELIRLSLINKAEITKEYSGMTRAILIDHGLLNKTTKVYTKTTILDRIFSSIKNLFNLASKAS